MSRDLNRRSQRVLAALANASTRLTCPKRARAGTGARSLLRPPSNVPEAPSPLLFNESWLFRPKRPFEKWELPLFGRLTDFCRHNGRNGYACMMLSFAQYRCDDCTVCAVATVGNRVGNVMSERLPGIARAHNLSKYEVRTLSIELSK